MFVSVPGQITPVLILEEFTRFVLSDLRNYAAEKRQSQIVLHFARDPAVYGVDVLESVVIEVEHGRTPVPAVRIDTAAFGGVGKSSIAVV